MNNRTQWILLLCLTVIQINLHGARLILSSGEKGSGFCNTHPIINWDRWIAGFAYEETTRPVQLELVITEPSTENNPFFPLKIKAFSINGEFLGESSDIHQNLLASPSAGTGLVSGTINVMITMNALLSSNSYNCQVDTDGTDVTRYPIIFRIYSGSTELPMHSNLFNHPLLLQGSNNYRTHLSLCGICIDDWKFKLGEKYSNYKKGPLFSGSSKNNLTRQKLLVKPKDPVTSSDLFRMYPNPAKNNLNIEIHEDEVEDLIISIISVFGGKKFNSTYENQSKIRLNITDLHPGNYYVHIKTSKRTVIRKLVIHD